MPKRRKDDGNGIPEWVVTYGDLMSLLLCFFILLAAFSELKQEREYLDVIKSVKEAFGYNSGVGRAPTEDVPANSLINRLDELDLRDEEASSEQHTPNIHNRSTRTTYLTEGIKFTIGGRITFQPASAELSPHAKNTLRQAADRIRGTRAKVEIRGHARGVEDTTRGESLMDLSYRRAKEARDFLINECNVSPQILIPVPVGDQEPAESSPFAASSGAEHRRVEIIQTEITIEEVNPDAYGTGRNRAGVTPDG